MFCWLFNLKNTDLIMTVKKVPKISWLRKFCNFCILHVHIMKITQYSRQANSFFDDNFTILYLLVEKVSHFYLQLKKSKFLKWCFFIESEYISWLYIILDLHSSFIIILYQTLKSLYQIKYFCMQLLRWHWEDMIFFFLIACARVKLYVRTW